MTLAILAFMFVLLLTGLVVAVSMAVQARRQLEHLEEQLPDPHGVWVEGDTEPAPWSSVDFTDLHDDVTGDDGDPYATLGADAQLEARVASGPKASEWKPTTDAAPREDIERAADRAPVARRRPVTWRATAAHRTTSHIVSDASAVTRDADRVSATGHSSEDERPVTDPAPADDPTEPPSWRETSDRIQQLLDELKAPLASNGAGSTPPPADAEQIAWRAPARATRSLHGTHTPPSNGASRTTQSGDEQSNGSRRPRGSAGDRRR
jgi:hypothetical protein